MFYAAKMLLHVVKVFYNVARLILMLREALLMLQETLRMLRKPFLMLREFCSSVPCNFLNVDLLCLTFEKPFLMLPKISRCCLYFCQCCENVSNIAEIFCNIAII